MAILFRKWNRKSNGHCRVSASMSSDSILCAFSNIFAVYEGILCCDTCELKEKDKIVIPRCIIRSMELTIQFKRVTKIVYK